MRQPLLYLILFLTPPGLFAQRFARTEKGRWLVLSGGYLYQGDAKRAEGNIELHRVRRFGVKQNREEKRQTALTWGPVLGLTATIVKQNTFRVGQQAGFSLVYNYIKKFPVGFKAAILAENYTKKDQRLSMAGGPLIGGILHLQYGYSIPLNRETIPGIGRHRLGLILHINTIGILEFFETVPLM